ncbi:MAG: hypothetical protein QXW80_06730 [Candidatus Micrarchaeia archaeon]
MLELQTSVDSVDNGKSTSNENEDVNMSKYEILNNAPFVLVHGPDGWFIVMGEHIVSEKRFKTKDEAKKYVDTKPWELIFVGAVAYMKILEKVKKDSDNFKNLNNNEQNS